MLTLRDVYIGQDPVPTALAFCVTGMDHGKLASH